MASRHLRAERSDPPIDMAAMQKAVEGKRIPGFLARGPARDDADVVNGTERATPTPDPSPHGGGEHTAPVAARLPLWKAGALTAEAVVRLSDTAAEQAIELAGHGVAEAQIAMAEAQAFADFVRGRSTQMGLRFQALFSSITRSRELIAAERARFAQLLDAEADPYRDWNMRGEGPGSEYDEQSCPGHVASERDPKICGRCGTHIDSLRPAEQEA